MGSLSRAVEEETAARAEDGLLIGSFQKEDAYRRSESRWRDLVGGGMTSFVLADFGRLRTPAGRPERSADRRLLADGRGVGPGLPRPRPQRLPGRPRTPPARIARTEIGFSTASSASSPRWSARPPRRRCGSPRRRRRRWPSSAQRLLDAAVDADPVARQLRLSGLITSRFIAKLG